MPSGVFTGPALEFVEVERHFRTPGGRSFVALARLSFKVAQGEFVAIVGPTGGGKSTLLNIAAGLLKPTHGTVLTFGEPVDGVNRRAAYLFQNDVLLPWKTAREWLARVGLEGFEDRYPHQLSGGMRKRVALAQALIVGPEVLLMDEPFSSLDVQTREFMENDLLALWQEDRKTVLFVTHDLEEAIALSDRVLVLSAGPEAHVVGSYPVELPRPRDVTEVRLDPRFREVYQAVWERLRGEVLRAFAFRERCRPRGDS